MYSDPSFAGRVPETRTVQHIIRAVRMTRNPADAWSLASDTDPDIDAALVLRTLAAVHTLTAGKVAFLTQDEARMVTRIRRAHPGMASVQAYVMAHRYLAKRRASEPSTVDLDLELAIQAFGGQEDVLDVVDVADVPLEPDQ